MQIFIMARNNKLSRTLEMILAAAFWILIWEAASRLVGDELSLFLPSPFVVIKSLITLLPQLSFWKATSATLLRIFAGFLLGVILGIALGMITSNIWFADVILSPIIKIIRAVPVVSFIILMYLFITVDKLPIFISLLMVAPMMWQPVHDGIKNADTKLCEMGEVFGMGKFKILFNIKLPIIINSILSACVGGLGFAWKSGVAAEVLCTPAISIGKNIYRAKGNLDYPQVYALTVTIVILSLIFEYLLKFLWRKFNSKGENIDDKT